MMEQANIQQLGFKNVSRDAKIIGFQVRYRINYYRGVWLSQSEGVEIAVDGEKFSGDQITWTLRGRTYTQKELTGTGLSDVHWGYLEPVTFTVSKPGGLKLGVHEVRISEVHRISYMPYPAKGYPSQGGPWPAGMTRKLVLVK